MSESTTVRITTADGDYVDKITGLCDICGMGVAIYLHHAITVRRGMGSWTDREILDKLAEDLARTQAACPEEHGRRAKHE
jgi:hypothetical protein